MSKPILIKAEEGVKRGEGTSYVITNYLTREKSSKVSVAVSELKGKLWKTMNKESDRVYYLLDGYGNFHFEDITFETKAGDVVYVPARTPYFVEGEFRAVLINSPAFQLSKEVKLE